MSWPKRSGLSEGLRCRISASCCWFSVPGQGGAGRQGKTLGRYVESWSYQESIIKVLICDLISIRIITQYFQKHPYFPGEAILCLSSGFLRSQSAGRIVGGWWSKELFDWECESMQFKVALDAFLFIFFVIHQYTLRLSALQKFSLLFYKEYDSNVFNKNNWKTKRVDNNKIFVIR